MVKSRSVHLISFGGGGQVIAWKSATAPILDRSAQLGLKRYKLYMNEYIKWLRSKIGSEKIIYPGARIIIENQNKEILFIERADNGKKGLPAGSLEENETIEECIIREVKEETGLIILDLEVIGISSNPHNESVVYPNGDKIQYFTIEFYSNNWEGEIKVEDESEVRWAKFLGSEIINQLPENERSIFDSLKYYRKTKKTMLK